MQKINPREFRIKSRDGKLEEFSETAITTFTYWESILSTSVQATINYVDAGSRSSKNQSSGTESEGLDIQGTEKIYLSFYDEDNNQLRFNTDVTALRIYNGNPVLSDTKKEVISFNLCTTEYLKKFYSDYYVAGFYEGKISDSVNKILKADLKTKKPVYIDETINTLRFCGGVDWTSQDALLWLAPQCIPNLPSAKGKTAGYFFYETSEGFKFKSIDVLLGQKPKKTYIFTNTSSVPSGTSEGRKYQKILTTPIFKSSVNAANLIRQGAYNSLTYVYDPVYDKVKPITTDKSDQKSGISMAGKNMPDFMDPDLTGTTRINFTTKDLSLLPGVDAKEQLTRSNQENLVVTDIVNQSQMRYQQLFAIELSFTIFADLTLHAGDVIECFFPEISSKATQPTSSKKSGLYMIVDLCHHISTNGPSYTVLNLTRDSYGRRINQ
jgi:hypothetical protein